MQGKNEFCCLIGIRKYKVESTRFVVAVVAMALAIIEKFPFHEHDNKGEHGPFNSRGLF